MVFAVFFILFNSELPKIFLDYNSVADFADNVEVVTIAAQLLIIAAIFQFTDALQVVALGALRGMQDVKIPTVICFIAYWIIGFPISYYLSMHTSLESMGFGTVYWQGFRLVALCYSSDLIPIYTIAKTFSHEPDILHFFGALIRTVSPRIFSRKMPSTPLIGEAYFLSAIGNTFRS